MNGTRIPSDVDRANEDDSVYVSAVIKGGERYIIVSDESTRAEALRVIGRWASHPGLSFNWYDAAKLSQKIRAGVTS